MPTVSVTRLKLRHAGLLPGFAWANWRSLRQVQKADGLIAGYLGVGPGLAFWTVTLWRDGAAAPAYRNQGAHAAVMPKLAGWCSEASAARWETAVEHLPEPAEAAERLRTEGRLSKVRRPSPAHAALRTAPPGAPLVGPRLRPAPNRDVVGGKQVQ